MTGTVAQIWRHPIKSIGAEPLRAVELSEDLPLPLDRAWAVLQEGGDTSDGWRPCSNFVRAAKGPSLVAITARTEGEVIHLSHPERPDLSITPTSPDAAATLIDWVTPIYPENRQAPAALVKSPDQGMTDTPFASVSILNLSSLRALSQKAGREMDPRRFRGNIWLEGLAPWEEKDLVGKTVRIGEAEIEIVEDIVRCRATEANPDTGRRDVPTLQLLEEGWGHTEFGVYGRVRSGGRVALGDPLTL